MGYGAAQIFFGDVFVCDGLDDFGPGDKHVAGAFHHEDEIGKRGRITAPPAHGPIMAEICGTTPLASVLRKKMSA